MANKHDTYHASEVAPALAPTTVTAVTNGDIVEVGACHALRMIVDVTAYTDGSHVLSLIEGDDPALADGAPVSAEETLGSDQDPITAAGAYHIGYIGKKAYVQLVVTATGAVTGADMSAVVSRENLVHANIA